MTDNFTISYKFTLPDASTERYDLIFSSESMEIIDHRHENPPAWTELEYHQCPHCPLSIKTHPHCPVAVNLSIAIDRCDHLMSFDRIVVEVSSAERQVTAETSAQKGISSLMGLLIAGSQCPLTHFFKPMARFHLPFSSKDETLWRATATFLLARYFTPQGLKASDMTLEGLVKIYDDIILLNNYMAQRLRSATYKDSAVNALVHLDVFAKFLTPPLEDSLEQIKHIYSPFLTKA